MARYSYIVSSGGEELWVKDGVFEQIGPNDGPQHYDPATSLALAKQQLFDQVLKGSHNSVIHKFDAQPPYKYHGLV